MHAPQSMGPRRDAIRGRGSARERRKADVAASAVGAGARRRRTLRSALARRIQSVSQKPLAVRSRKMKSEVGSATGSAAHRTGSARHKRHKACPNRAMRARAVSLRTLGHAAVCHQRASHLQHARNLRRRSPAHAVEACGASPRQHAAAASHRARAACMRATHPAWPAAVRAARRQQRRRVALRPAEAPASPLARAAQRQPPRNRACDATRMSACVERAQRCASVHAQLQQAARLSRKMLTVRTPRAAAS